MRHGLYTFALLALSACGSPHAAPQSAPAPPAERPPAPPARERVLVSDFFVEDDRLAHNGYEVVRREGPGDESYAVLRRRGRVLARFDGVRGGAGNATDFGLFPLLGGGSRQLVVSQTVPRGGRHWVVDLSEGVRVVHDSAEYGPGREEVSALDVDGDGVYELSGELTTFVFFEGLTTGASPVVDILLRYDPRARAGTSRPATSSPSTRSAA